MYDAAQARRFEECVVALAKQHRNAQFELDTQHFIKAEVDEMSVFFRQEVTLDAFVQWCTEQGYDHFNDVRDDVHQTYANHDLLVPLRPKPFEVRFAFIQIPGAPYRIEAMTVLAGTSAVHDLCATGEIVHASWKYPDAEAYKAGLASMAYEGGGFKPLPRLASYRNSYGEFTYYGSGVLARSGNRAPYFKPRVNLRDSASVQQ